MAWSTVLRFSDPLACQVAVQGAEVEVFPTVRGRFDTEITKIRFDRVWMHRSHSRLPQVITVAHKPNRQAISFLTEPRSPTLLYCGMEVVPGAIIVNRPDLIHKRSDGETRNGSISVPLSELEGAARAITGVELPNEQGSIVQPNHALMSRLLNLHKAVGRLAHYTPDILELPEVARALEEQMIHLMVRCLVDSAHLQNNTAGHRHDAIIAKFEEYLAAHPNQPLYLIEICAGIGVAERTLRASCEEHLGMGPIRYLTLRRMHLLRRALLGADASKTNVTRMVTDHGFWELGRFSVAYRSLFGESPSETLRRPAEHPANYLDRPSKLPADVVAAGLN